MFNTIMKENNNRESSLIFEYYNYLEDSMKYMIENKTYKEDRINDLIDNLYNNYKDDILEYFCYNIDETKKILGKIFNNFYFKNGDAYLDLLFIYNIERNLGGTLLMTIINNILKESAQIEISDFIKMIETYKYYNITSNGLPSGKDLEEIKEGLIPSIFANYENEHCYDSLEIVSSLLDSNNLEDEKLLEVLKSTIKGINEKNYKNFIYEFMTKTALINSYYGYLTRLIGYIINKVILRVYKENNLFTKISETLFIIDFIDSIDIPFREFYMELIVGTDKIEDKDFFRKIMTRIKNILENKEKFKFLILNKYKDIIDKKLFLENFYITISNIETIYNKANNFKTMCEESVDILKNSLLFSEDSFIINSFKKGNYLNIFNNITKDIQNKNIKDIFNIKENVILISNYFNITLFPSNLSKENYNFIRVNYGWEDTLPIQNLLNPFRLPFLKEIDYITLSTFEDFGIDGIEYILTNNKRQINSINASKNYFNYFNVNLDNQNDEDIIESYSFGYKNNFINNLTIKDIITSTLSVEKDISSRLNINNYSIFLLDLIKYKLRNNYMFYSDTDSLNVSLDGIVIYNISDLNTYIYDYYNIPYNELSIKEKENISSRIFNIGEEEYSIYEIYGILLKNGLSYTEFSKILKTRNYIFEDLEKFVNNATSFNKMFSDISDYVFGGAKRDLYNINYKEVPNVYFNIYTSITQLDLLIHKINKFSFDFLKFLLENQIQLENITGLIELYNFYNSFVTRLYGFINQVIKNTIYHYKNDFLKKAQEDEQFLIESNVSKIIEELKKIHKKLFYSKDYITIPRIYKKLFEESNRVADKILSEKEVYDTDSIKDMNCFNKIIFIDNSKMLETDLMKNLIKIYKENFIKNGKIDDTLIRDINGDFYFLSFIKENNKEKLIKHITLNKQISREYNYIYNKVIEEYLILFNSLGE